MKQLSITNKSAKIMLAFFLLLFSQTTFAAGHQHGQAHGLPNAENRNVPQAGRDQSDQSASHSKQGIAGVNAVACNVNAFATSNSTTLINEIKTQGSSCVNDLFSASAGVQATAFESNNMYQVANHTKSLAASYAGNGDPDLEALYLYLRAGYYVEFYNNSVTFAAWVTPAVKGAIDAFVNNSSFYNNNDAHGKVLQEVITTMDSSEQQDVYVYVVKEWLYRWNSSYAANWNMRSAVNGIFTLLFRGQWNTNFASTIGNDTTLVTRLRDFALSSWMIGTDSEFMIANAGRELGRLKSYSGTAIQSTVDSALNSIFATYEMYGNGDAVWLGAADTATYYVDCSAYNICGFKEQVEALALSQIHTCSSTIRIRSQNLTGIQQSAACSAMGAEETIFHQKLQTNNQPVADDNNSFLQVNIFDSSADYGKYAGVIFGIDTNNGGMYLEGNPAVAGNVANFIAYEATYANPDHYVWNLEHEYVHYLDGRFDLYGDFNAPTERTVWWSEGVAEYIANGDNNQAAIDTINDGSTYTLATIFETTYDGFDQDRIYRWGYLAVRFMFERHNNEVQAMLASTRAGNWAAYKSRVNTWASAYGSEFTTWTQGLSNNPGNQAPVAVVNGPYSGSTTASVNFSSSGSYDPDGSIASYSWNFGDGSAASSSANPSHNYTTAGTYTVTLTVTDNAGLTSSSSTTANITGGTGGGNALQNGQSVSNLSANTGNSVNYYIDVPANASNLVISISGGTGDADLYTRFNAAPTDSTYNCRPYVGGNNESCTEASPTAGRWYIRVKAYSTYSGITLTASYDAGSSNVAPVANANGPYSGTEGSAISFSSAGSNDPDGSISSYSWNFGDGNSSASANPSHSYAAAGTYTVTLTVTDNNGATNTASTSATVTAIVNNVAPVADANGPYSGTATNAISFSSAGSSDSDGSIVSYSWDFGDGNSASSANPSHSYASEGTYTVTLTVTDNDGATDTATTSATVTTGGGSGNELQNGAAQSVSGGTGEEILFTMQVPANATDLSFITSGGSGDADLYVRFGAAPTTSNYDCRPYQSGNNETCNISNVQAGTYYVMLRGYSAFSNLSLIGSYSTGGGSSMPDACATQGPITGGSLADGDVQCLANQSTIWLSIPDINSASSVAISTGNGSGDLTVRYSNSGWPSSSTYDAISNNSGSTQCITLNSQSSYWGYLQITGSTGGSSIVVDFDSPSCR